MKPSIDQRHLPRAITAGIPLISMAKLAVTPAVVPNLPIAVSTEILAAISAILIAFRITQWPRLRVGVLSLTILVFLAFYVSVLPPLRFAHVARLDLLYILTVVQALLLMAGCILACEHRLWFVSVFVVTAFELHVVFAMGLERQSLLISLVGVTVLLAVAVRQVRIIQIERQRVSSLYAEQRELNRRLAVAAGMTMEEKRRASLAMIAAGLAHEINNPLTYVNGFLHYLHENISRLGSLGRRTDSHGSRSDELDEIDEIEEDSRKILESVDQGLSRIQEVVTGLRDLSRESRADAKPMLVKRAVESVIATIGPDALCGVEIRVRIPDDLTIRLSHADFFTVVLNLLANAADAAGHHGRVIVAAGEDSAGSWLSVTDNGSGIPQNKLELVFEPFVTDKNDRDHIGVGLALCRHLIEQNDGTIAISSKVGEYTCVTVRIPSSDGFA
jgi:signal transduction histidine kinase